MNEYKIWLKINSLKPVRFYPYTSHVSNRILSQSHNYQTPEHDFLENLGNQIKESIEDQINWDNKVVVECEISSTLSEIKTISNIFIGKKDGIWSVGLGVYGDSWITPIELK